MSNQENIKSILIDGHTFHVALDWADSDAKNSLLLGFDVKKKARASGMHYGATHFHKSEDGVIVSQYTLNEQPMDSKDIIGAKFVAEKIADLETLEGTFIFIKSIGDQLNDRFWLCAVNQSGHIHSQDDKVIDGIMPLSRVVDELRMISNNITLAFIDGEVVVRDAINHLSDEDGVKIDPIPAAAIESYLESHSSYVKRFYKESAIPVKKTAIMVGAAVAIGIAGLGVGYMGQSEPQSFFESESFRAMVEDDSSVVAKYLKDQKSSKDWDDESFRKNVVTGFTNFYLSHNYESNEIGQIFADIERNLPMYAAEWQFVKIGMENGKFYVLFKRIPKSKGTFRLLDEYMASIDEQVNELSITPFQLKDGGNSRIYQIESLRYKDMILAKETASLTQRERHEIRRDMLKINNDLKGLYGDLENAQFEFNNMPFIGRYVLQSGNVHVDDANGVVKRIEKLQKKLRVLNKKLGELPPPGINLDWVNGDVLDFVTMMHVDSLFEWSYPQKDIGFPEISVLKAGNKKAESKNKKKKTSKSKKQAKVYEQAIESYVVEIKTHEAEDEEGTVSSYGVLDLRHLMFLLDKSYIQVEKIEYLKDSEQWGVTARFYTKTDEYDNTVVIDEHTKD